MVKMSRYIILLLVLFCACEKELKLDIPAYEPQVVFEGSIYPDEKAGIVLTLTAPFFNDFDSMSMLAYRLTTPKVTIENSEKKEVLRLKRLQGQYPPYVFNSKTIYGEVGEEYKVEVITQGDTIRSTTTIPGEVEVDSVWTELQEGSDSSFYFWIKLSDPPQKGNYYRVQTKIEGVDSDFVPTRTSVFSDEHFNGKTIELPLRRGEINILEKKEHNHFRIGSVVIVEVSTMTREAYDFWYSYSSLILSAGNPFASPHSNLEGNIDGGIGIWAGYNPQYDTIDTRGL